ncbi:homoserine kinase [Anaeroplasma bactoclasticum]|uniref:Homoserine kinase n=2 Tax=Anaeroplasma bactoclasticum TaxID=2088 RepID=A0A397S1K2_9MOLU|nr:homoserine kinase [Anaeroplasma bactoclasticum]
MLKIKVEATSANVCVGFDVLGIALNLYNEFTFKKSSEFKFVGFEEEFSSCETNLVYEAYKYVFDLAKEVIVPVEIGFIGDIPVSRGLGSSSSLIVAGIFAANYYLKNKYSKRELFDIATAIEGHPDNVAPAIYGGLVASYQKDGKYYPNIYPIHKDLKFSVVIPNVKVSTHDARGVLPKELPYKDIVWNLSRIVNLPKAFMEGNIELLKDLFSDKLHEPYRSKLIPAYSDIKSIINKYNAAFAISGSGSTMLIVSKDLSFMDELKQIDYPVLTLEVGSGVKVEELYEGWWILRNS